MEKLVINVPDDKSVLVKQMLKAFGVTIEVHARTVDASYRQKLEHVSNWFEDDLNQIDGTVPA